MTYTTDQLIALRARLLESNCRSSLDLTIVVDLHTREHSRLQAIGPRLKEEYHTIYQSISRLRDAHLIKTDFIDGRKLGVRLTPQGKALFRKTTNKTKPCLKKTA